jgi:cytochrome c oxidase subunit 4
MAQEKKSKGTKAPKIADDEKTLKSGELQEEEHVSAKVTHAEDGHGEAALAHGDADHAHGDADHEHKPNRKEYLVIFVALVVLTVLEVGLAQVPGISKPLMRLGLVGMALAKAGLVAMFYMHLKHETRVLRLTVAIPLATPALYAVILISEAAWRLIR